MNVGACKKYGLDTMGSNKGSHHFYWKSLSNLYSATYVLSFPFALLGINERYCLQ